MKVISARNDVLCITTLLAHLLELLPNVLQNEMKEKTEFRMKGTQSEDPGEEEMGVPPDLTALALGSRGALLPGSQLSWA